MGRLPRNRGPRMDRATRRHHPRQGGAGHRRARRRWPRAGTAAGRYRPGTVRILFAFDPWRSSILLVAGDKAGRWKSWYEEAIPLAEHRFEVYLKERAQQEEGR
ncbi:type II toxin-antitoxin system RelE/ParE family toxin [Microtetraspora malaysiensis]|uniref:type II toxin-antitoxin system RelE/ParE family toxin n=1 Tax=Microtetraspora malaysiensis TaxID=161358 RepID=UPI0034E1D546